MNIEREVQHILNIIEELKEPYSPKDLEQENMCNNMWDNPIYIAKKSCHICYVTEGFEHRNACSFSGRFKAR